MEYSTRQDDTTAEIHINYGCPCGCTAGVVYNPASRQSEVGRCCCGRVLVAGPNAGRRLATLLPDSEVFDLDLGAATLPWGERVATALAVPRGASDE